MLGMSLLSFLILLAIAAVVSAVMHYGARYRFLDGIDAFFGKLALAWLGAWLGSPVFGHWLWKVENIYLVPAILGAGVPVVFVVLTEKTLLKLVSTGAAQSMPLEAQRKAA